MAEQKFQKPESQSVRKEAPNAEFYTWQKFFQLLSGQGTDDDRKKYLLARDIAREELDCKRCEDHRDWIFKYSEHILSSDYGQV